VHLFIPRFGSGSNVHTIYKQEHAKWSSTDSPPPGTALNVRSALANKRARDWWKPAALNLRGLYPARVLPTPPTGGLCQQPGVLDDPANNPWVLEGKKVWPKFDQRYDLLCHGCPVIAECRQYASHLEWIGVVVGGWAAPSGYPAKPPWAENGEYPLPRDPQELGHRWAH